MKSWYETYYSENRSTVSRFHVYTEYVYVSQTYNVVTRGISRKDSNKPIIQVPNIQELIFPGLCIDRNASMSAVFG